MTMIYYEDLLDFDLGDKKKNEADHAYAEQAWPEDWCFQVKQFIMTHVLDMEEGVHHHQKTAHSHRLQFH